jgi:magnesium chelatase subunit H
MQITVLYVGSSLLGPLKKAEQEINRVHRLDLRVAAYNFGSALSDESWQAVDQDLARTDVVFVIHVMDGENGSRLLTALDQYRSVHQAVVVINCMPDLMRRTRMGRLEFSRKEALESEDSAHLKGQKATNGNGAGAKRIRIKDSSSDAVGTRKPNSRQALNLLGTIGSWIGKQAKRESNKSGNHTQYLKLVEMLPGFLRLVPTVGRLRDVKNYLFLFCYFLQPTPANIRAMLLYALKNYLPDERLRRLRVALPQALPTLAIYHPDATSLFESFDSYKAWYTRTRAKPRGQSSEPGTLTLKPEATIGLLLLRPQVISQTTKHYDELIRAIEAEGLSVIPVLSTLMDNREACQKFFVNEGVDKGSRRPKSKAGNVDGLRVSQIISLTGFSFVGGPAMNDSDAAGQFLRTLNRPYRSAVSLDMQTIEGWNESQIGLNPVQAGMQIAIPEIDGATEPFIYGGIPARGFEPVSLEERCKRFARRLKRWHHLQSAPREKLRIALVLFCFPPNKGNIGTAAELDVFPSVFDTLKRLKLDGYAVELPDSPDALRQSLLQGNSDQFASSVNVAYRMSVDEYRRLCPHVAEAERDWGTAPGQINVFGKSLLIQGIMLGNIFVGTQPTFGYEGDPMRLMMARSGAPHHGFLAFYTYLEKVFSADAVIHVGTHGALEFMPGKQVGLSAECWPDRLIGELPNLYLYSVNNPSEGSIAKRRSYAELISYLTPPIENAGLYKEFATLKELITTYRQADDRDREKLFAEIEEYSSRLNLKSTSIQETLRQPLRPLR